jgi:alpha-beta hydrolase superfamily lysophospholipase
MRSQAFDFAGADGQLLSGVVDLPDGPPQAVALFAHCFTCTKSSVAAVRVARALTVKSLAVLRFDFTGLGRSGGAFADSTFSGSVRDLVAASQALSQRLTAPSLLVGHSLGGAAVLAAAAHMPSVRAVATIGAPYEAAHVQHLLTEGSAELLANGEAQVHIGGRPFRLRRAFVEDLQMQDQGTRIRALGRALLVLHAARDTTVGIDNAAAIFQAARHPKSFVSLHDADHLLTRRADADYAAAVIAAWASRYLAPVVAAQGA